MANYISTNTGAEIDDAVGVAKGTGTGLVVKTSTGAGAKRTIAGTTNQITVVNGNGVDGNPTLSLPSAVTASLALADSSVQPEDIGTAAAQNVNAFAAALGANDNYVTDAEKVVIGNTSGTNTGDQDLSTYQLKPSEGAFANGDKTKLNGIETGADVTDTANVTAAGALMDSEVTNLAAVKSFNPANYATAAQGTLADSAVQPSALSVYALTSAIPTNNNQLTNGASYVTALALTGYALKTSLATVTTSGNISLSNDFINASGTITLTLPTAASNSGKIFYVRNSGSGVITIDTVSAQTINGDATLVLQFMNSVVGLISDDSNWNVL